MATMTDSGSILVEEKVIVVNKDKLKEVEVVGAIDRGCTLTKVLYSTVKDDQHYNLHMALFKNSDFEAGIDFLKDKGMIVQKPNGKLHITGIGGSNNKEMIEEKLGMQVEFINEFLTQGRGTHWLMELGQDAEFCYDDGELDLSMFGDMDNNQFVQMMHAPWKGFCADRDPEQKFPSILLFVGSASGAMKLEADGTSDLIGGIMLAGRCFLGLSQILLGTNNYHEIMELAMQGDRGNVDTQVKELMANDPTSFYGNFPSNLPFFPFGKGADNSELKIEELSKPDLAASLVGVYASNLVSMATMAAKLTNISKIYFGGNFFRHRLIRDEVRREAVLFSGNAVSVRFLRTGHTGAIGAMISKQEDAEQYLAFLKMQQEQQQQ